MDDHVIGCVENAKVNEFHDDDDSIKVIQDQQASIM